MCDIHANSHGRLIELNKNNIIIINYVVEFYVCQLQKIPFHPSTFDVMYMCGKVRGTYALCMPNTKTSVCQCTDLARVV